jgi:hypothetical protein
MQRWGYVYGLVAYPKPVMSRNLSLLRVVPPGTPMTGGLRLRHLSPSARIGLPATAGRPIDADSDKACTTDSITRVPGSRNSPTTVRSPSQTRQYWTHPVFFTER